MARISMGTTMSGTMMSSILVWMLTLPKNRGRFPGMGDTAYTSSVYSGTAAFCPRTDQCCSVTEVSVRLSIVFIYGTNSTALFTAKSLMGLYRKRKYVGVGVPFHLADQRLLVLPIHGA